MSLNTPLTTDTAGITTTIVSDDTTLTNSLETKPLPTHAVSTSESIRDFLAKPYLIYSGVWSSTDATESLLFGGFGLATDEWLENLTSYNQKITGFSMTRSTIVFRLQINATPFHQGKLLMHFLPMAPLHNSLAPAIQNWVSMHNWNLTTRTMQPSIEVDCRETAVELRLPYIAPTDYYTLGSTTDRQMQKITRGSVYLSVLSALKMGLSATSVDYSFYVSFEDVDLVGPLVPQSGAGGRMKRVGALKEKEAKAMATTPVSHALSVAGKIASTLGSIPMLSSIATPASWVLQAASGLASAFGWSKPANEDTGPAISRQWNRFAATSDGSDYAMPLAMKVGNHVTTTTSKTITDMDEMSFSFLKSVDAYVNTVNWTASATQGSLLTSKKIGPRQIFRRDPKTRGGTTLYLDSGPPAWYLSNLFKQYRGSIKVKIRIAKTEFHSGRLQITFTPRCVVNNTPSTTSAFYSLREIIDIRAGNEMEFILPYIMPTPYLDIESSIGQLDIHVLNELRAPETVAQNVDLLFYYSAGDDFELAVPGYSANTKNYVPFAPQSGVNSDVATDSTLIMEGIGGTPVFRADVTHAEHCVGEIFASIRQFLTRYNQIWTSTLPPATGPRVAFWPFFANCLTLSSAGVKTSGKYGGDLFSYFAPMYTFYRGGMRVQVDTAAAVGSLSLTLTPGQVAPTREVFSTSTAENGSASAVAFVDSPNTTPSGTALTDAGIGLYAVSVPYYCKTPVSLVVPTSNDRIPYYADNGLEYSVPQSAISVETQSTPVYYRSIAEDFQFLYFVGCPPLVTSTTALAAAPLTISDNSERDMPLTKDGTFDEVLFFATS